MTATNENLNSLIKELRTKAIQEKVNLWKRLADDLSRSTRSRRVVNLVRIAKNIKKDEIIAVPGKVLAMGELTEKLEVAAYKFSDSAIEKIKQVGGNAISLQELMEKNPKGSKVRILG